MEPNYKIVKKPIPEKLSTQIDAGVQLAITKAIERHRRLGESISIWQDGQVVTLTADQIPPADLTQFEISHSFDNT